MGFDGLVDLLHDADGFGKGDDNSVVVGDVVFCQDPTEATLLRAAVFEPLFADLIAADVEVPDFSGDGCEAARLRLVDPDGLV